METTEMKGYKVFRITLPDGECEYYAGQDAAAAMAAHDAEWMEKGVSIEEISDAQLDELTVVLCDEDERPTEETLTFREHLRDEIRMFGGEAFRFCQQP